MFMSQFAKKHTTCGKQRLRYCVLWTK